MSNRVASARVLPWMGRLAALAVIVATAAGCVPPNRYRYVADFYVAANGNDGWSGRLATPNYSGTDGPFATVERARDALRSLTYPRYQAIGRFVVLIRGGVYYLDRPIVFQPDDSGSATAPILYAAYPGESPVFTGARPITGWTPGPGGIWTAPVPDFVPRRPMASAAPGRPWHFNQLWIADRRCTRARSPNAGYLHTDGPLPQFGDPRQHRDDLDAKLGFRYKAGDLKSWQDLEDANLVVYHAWTTSRHWIARLDEQKNEAHLTAPSAWPFGYWDRSQRYHVENVREALDAPGEWYLDRKTRLLHYWPLPGDDLHRTPPQAPVTPELVRFDGEPAGGRTVHHIILRGLNFRHADWWLDRTRPADGQAAAFLTSAAVMATGMERCVIEYCEVGHVGTHGIWLAAGCKDNRIVHCHIHDLGAGGIRIGETESPSHAAMACERNKVDNCYIHDGGHVFKGGAGVWIGRSSHNSVTHNEIADFDYSGVSCGWTWGYTPTTANHNAIELNHIHHIGRGVLNDLAGVYTLGVSPGTRIRYNRIHDVRAHQYGGWGIYADEGTSNVLIESNLVYNTSHGGFHLHYGRDNTVRNNIFALSRDAQLVRTREEPHHAVTFTNNIVYCDHPTVLGGHWRNASYRFDSNLYWVTTGAPPDFGGRSFGQWQAALQDRHSIVADPRFVNPAVHDFRIGHRSAARRIRFRPIDASRIGLYGQAYWVNAPRRGGYAPTLPTVRAPRAVFDDFETTPVGAQAATGTTSGEQGGASIRVTRDTAASGVRSLKVTDAPGLQQAWDPQLYYLPRHSDGTMRLAFDLRLERGAEVWHEWRTQGQYYQSGPSIRFGPQGQVISGGRMLTTLPVGQWCHVEIVCRLGAAATGRYDLTLNVLGRAQRFDGLACGSPSFGRLQWLGFMSMSPGHAVWYLDNIRLDRLN
ncbi:right-handed parallel beta-helix repeat-containing protein [Planctomycetota bacterium]